MPVFHEGERFYTDLLKDDFDFLLMKLESEIDEVRKAQQRNELTTDGRIDNLAQKFVEQVQKISFAPSPR